MDSVADMGHSGGTGLTTPEVGRRLGITAGGVYRLIFAGDLDGRPDSEGKVRVSEASVVAYLERMRASPG